MARRLAAVVLASALLASAAAPQEKGPVAPGPWKPPPRGGPPPTDPKAPLGERVNGAIDAGVAWLRTRASASGSFGPMDGGERNYLGGTESYLYPAGPTTLSLYTLLKCGVPADDPVVARGFAWLKAKQPVPCTSYEISVLILALDAKVHPGRGRKAAESAPPVKGAKNLSPADAAWMKSLLAQLERRRQGRPGWRYNMADPPDKGEIQGAWQFGGDLDMSSTQLAVLAMAAGERCGFRQPDGTWLAVLQWVLEEQEPTGPAVPVPGAAAEVSTVADRARGWGYLPRARNPKQEPTGSMTACGLGNVVIAGAILASRGNREWKARIEGRAESAWRDGNAWLAKNWKIPENPRGSGYYYWMYCLERAGDLRGAALLGGHDWYAEGAAYLVDAQYPDGSWWGLGESMPSDLLGTCFALLFLDRSTRAVSTDREPK